ncbi:MAG: HTH domain-containing protein, partial [Anaerovoracaceae bacterium]
ITSSAKVAPFPQQRQPNLKSTAGRQAPADENNLKAITKDSLKTREANAINGRHLEMLIYLLKHKKTTYGQLAKHFEVSVKTIERDIDRLSSMGVPVYCTQGIGGGVQIDEKYKFGTSFFSVEDIHEIIFALKIVDSFSIEPTKNSIINKLCLIAPELSAMFESDAENYLSIDLLTEKLVPETWRLEKIDYCLDEEVLVTINDTLTVAPIGYVLKADGMYLFCFAETYQLIKFADIKKIEVTDTGFQREFISYEEFKKNNI